MLSVKYRFMLINSKQDGIDCHCAEWNIWFDFRAQIWSISSSKTMTVSAETDAPRSFAITEARLHDAILLQHT